jgi:hypothetical protein
MSLDTGERPYMSMKRWRFGRNYKKMAARAALARLWQAREECIGLVTTENGLLMSELLFDVAHGAQGCST